MEPSQAFVLEFLALESDNCSTYPEGVLWMSSKQMAGAVTFCKNLWRHQPRQPIPQVEPFFDVPTTSTF